MARDSATAIKQKELSKTLHKGKNKENMPPSSAKANHKGSKSSSKSATAKINQDMQQELEMLKKQLRKAQKAQKAAEAASSTHRKARQGQDQLIPRPKGSAGDRKNGFVIIDEMGLKDDEETYNSMIRCIHDWVLNAQLDWRFTYRNQPHDKLAKIFKLARETFPTLERFQNDWATAELLKQYITNRRKYAKKQGYTDLRQAAVTKCRAAGTGQAAPIDEVEAAEKEHEGMDADGDGSEGESNAGPPESGSDESPDDEDSGMESA
ncbi:hypothetical protein EW146_g2191 [Bondarzewia mesenterica]|uniref:Uncharacterized protein n=1 Tax=Bondarzewia mesenterica TaxID=1095465 RepID=A0A4V3XFU5_9AGAM|nr:hypothetical protein EW146_g2191 [Bondarzewia mesenterica]